MLIPKAKALGIGVAWIVRVKTNLSARGIEAVQPAVGREPQETGTVLANLLDLLYRKVGEGLCLWIEAIQGLLAAYPYGAVAIFEQRLDVDAAETIRVAPLVHVHLECVAVESIQPV